MHRAHLPSQETQFIPQVNDEVQLLPQKAITPTPQQEMHTTQTQIEEPKAIHSGIKALMSNSIVSSVTVQTTQRENEADEHFILVANPHGSL